MKHTLFTLSQSGTSAPVSNVFDNTLDGSIAWSYVDVGTYVGTLAGAFPAGATAISPRFMNSQESDFEIEVQRTDDDTITVYTMAFDGTAINGRLNEMTFEIWVKPC